MKMILIETIDKLGKIGDIVMVKEGYARNYLIPNKKARPATAENMKILEALKKKRAQAEAKNFEEAKALAEKISGLSITISAKSGEEDKLYGAITSDAIASSLAAEGCSSIDKKDIILDEPIKKLGAYQVTVKILPEVKATLRVWVVKE